MNTTPNFSRQKQIIDQATTRSEMCSSHIRDIYRVAFRDGAEWADANNTIKSETLEHIKDLLLKVERDQDGNITEDLKKRLSYLDDDKAIVGLDVEDWSFYVIKHNLEPLNDIKTIKWIFLAYM